MSGLGFTHWGASLAIAFGASFCTIDYANAKVTTSTSELGNAGNITINSGSFSLQDGAQITAVTFGQGNAGTIKVKATDFFTISSNSSNFNSDFFVNSQSTTGTAGDIIVTSPRITLDNSGTLNAKSASGSGGDINLQTDLLLLRRRGAQITTTAGTALTGGNGGNINIDVPSGFIVAVPSENSDITANGFTGNGGRVDIQGNQISIPEPNTVLGVLAGMALALKLKIKRKHKATNSSSPLITSH